MRAFARSLLLVVLPILTLLPPSGSVAVVAAPAAGGLDRGFGASGVVKIGFPGGAGVVAGVVAQRDGRIVVATAGDGHFALARLLPNGQLDRSFGSGGLVSTPVNGARAAALLLQADGRIVVGGSGQLASRDFVLARYTADGDLDKEFGAYGLVSLDFDGADDTLFSLAQQPDGKIVAAGLAGSALAIGVARLNTDGALDSTFGATGEIIYNVGGDAGLSAASSVSLAVQPGGNLLLALAGRCPTIDIQPDCGVAFRLARDGKFDDSFATGGWLRDAPAAASLAQQPDGRFVLAGHITTFSLGSPHLVYSLYALRRYTADGAIDTSFGSTLTAPTIPNIMTDRRVQSGRVAAIAPDGRIVVAASGGGLLRYNAAGELDHSFSPGGLAATPFAGDALALLADGRVLVAGTLDGQIAVARYLAATPCAPAFGDVATSDYYAGAVQYLYCRGAVSGYASGEFKPYNNVTRAQFVKMLITAKGWQLSSTDAWFFSDGDTFGSYFPYIDTAQRLNLISGYPCGVAPAGPCRELGVPYPYFLPNQDLTRGQMAKIIVKAQGWAIDAAGAGHFDDVPSSNPFYKYVETAYRRGALSGYADGAFRWQESTTRGQAAKVIYVALGQ